MSKQLKRNLLIVAVVALLGLLWLLVGSQNDSEKDPKVSAKEAASSGGDNESESQFSWAEKTLRDHGRETTDPLGDVRMVFLFVREFALVNHHIDALHYSTNASLTEVLLGRLPLSPAMLPADADILGKNTYGETVIIDRWGTPYHVHVVHEKRIEFRSAGVDKKMGTADDLLWPLDQ